MDHRRFLFLLICLSSCWSLSLYAFKYDIKGRVIDKISREPIPFASIRMVGDSTKMAMTDTTGVFTFAQLNTGTYRFTVTNIGYKTVTTPEYMLTNNALFIEVEMEENTNQLQSVVVGANVFRRFPETPVSLRLIGLQEIEKSPGANRDISRIVRSYPGVAYSPAGYRNDLIVRGGSPSENKFYMDGIEIPNINHFSTQGASGGPVGLINADFIREVKFYTGSFPTDKGNALSSVLDFQLKDGNLAENTYRATLGASEVAFSGDGHFSEKTTYLFSVRQSYMQLLFKFLGLPFLPKFTDAQFKVKHRFNAKNEITFLGLAGIDDMKLNTSVDGESAEYILSYLPTIKQETFTLGATYKHYGGKNIQSVSLSHSYLNNRNYKYKDNDESNEENLTLKLKSTEQKTTLRFENKTYLSGWTWNNGVESAYVQYDNNTFQRLFTNMAHTANYNTNLGFMTWGLFTHAVYTSPDERFTASAGVRADGADYSSETRNLGHTLSPRLSLSYALNSYTDISGSTGIYYQLPPYTSLGFKDNDGNLVNKEQLKYIRVTQGTVGINFNIRNRGSLSAELFYKKYGHIPLSVDDNIPLLCKGTDYGVIGNELLVSSAEGRAYGLELLGKWQIPNKWSFVSSITLFRSEYRNDANSSYIASAWDNRILCNMSCTYELPRSWSIGARFSYLGGAPYTPYDEDKSSLIEAWDASGRPYYDYSQYNEKRMSGYYQLDLRIDKTYYFKNIHLGFYIDLQNLTVSKYRQPDVLLSTGQINPDDPTRYVMKKIKQESGTLLPTLGVTVEF